MKVTVNGQLETITVCTIADYVHAKGLDSASLVVEYNRRIIRQDQWASVQLKNNDTMELLGFVGGG